MGNILAVGAHYDDVELGCSGTLIKHVLAGDHVRVLVVTDSAYNNPNGTSIRDAKTAYQEGQAAARVMGLQMECLNYKTFEVPFDENLTKLITRYIEEDNIDTVYSHWIKDIHRDHQYTARCTLMAARHVPRTLMYRSNFYNAGDPFVGNFYSDISAVMERKMEGILSHHSELERVRYSWLDFIKKQNSNDGQIIGVDFAECFEVVQYLI